MCEAATLLERFCTSIWLRVCCVSDVFGVCHTEGVWECVWAWPLRVWLCNGPCVCVRWRVWVFPVGRWDIFFSHNSSRSQVTPVFSRTYFAFFPSPVYHTPSSGFGRQIFPPLRLQNSLFLSRNPSLFPLTQLGRDCRDYRLLVTVMCVCVYSLLQL